MKMTCWARGCLQGAPASIFIEIKIERPSVTGEHRTNHQLGDNPVKRTVLAILAFATLVFAPPATGEDIGGWQEAKWGMTPDELQKALSYPTIVVDLAKVCGENCEEGAALELDDYDLNGQHFMVRFWFTKADRRLHTVSMYAKQLGDANGNEAFTKMKRFLETSYDSPRSTELKRGYFIIIWVLPSTTITLYSNTTNEMIVVYEENTKKEGGGS
jgi:hypothetical protein